MMIKTRILTIATLLLSHVLCPAQDMAALYKQSDEYGWKIAKKLYNSPLEFQAIDSAQCYWYSVNTQQGKEFVLLDATDKSKRPAFDHSRLAKELGTVLNRTVEPNQLPFQTIRFGKKMKSITFTADGKEYACDLDDYRITGRNRDQRSDRYWGKVYQEDSPAAVKSPDGNSEAYIVEGNLWVKDLKTGKAKVLSFDGSPYEYYSSNIYWSPDSKKIVCCKYRPAGVRQLNIVASSPKDQLQPKIETVDYIKPGDALPLRRPVMFVVETGQQINIALPDAEKQFSLHNIRWNKESSRFTFHVNERGHQHYDVYDVDTSNGKLSMVIHEQSPTFIHYSALYHYFFENTGEMLWISERDGWRHLYLYDIRNGQVKKQLTRGEWVVKSVVRVDEKNRTAILKACGRDAGEDPYLEKYYTLNIDKGTLTPLTPENAWHQVAFSFDYSYILDKYSRVDLPPVTVLRSAKDGKILMEVEKADISGMLEAGWRMPEVFSAKGRDGKTDIWGLIIRPDHFDPAKKYPVVEYIYAGPHDSHVPKTFAPALRTAGFSQLGFITVMIDGMGTANRSKAFHDVCWKNLKDAGFPDRIAWMKAAAQRYPEMDLDRVGIYGSSAGGQSAMGALLFHPEFYKVGVAACGCHDNRMDKIWWNEQWMGYPIGPQYEESSNVCNARLLQGKLMLILGELDNNVDPSSTLQVVNELINHKKEFEFVMLPNVGHTLGGDYGERKRRDFFMKYLLGIEPSAWNE